MTEDSTATREKEKSLDRRPGQNFKIEEHRFWLCKCNKIVCQIKGHSELGSPYARAELIVLVDFKAIYPRVPPGIFAGFPGVAHFLSFKEICQYPRVPQGKVANPWGTLGYYFPGVDPREIKIPGVHLTF